MNKVLTKKTIIFITGILLASAIGIFSYMVFWNSSTSYPVEKVSSTLINKIGESSVNGALLKLNNEDINAIIGMYFKIDKTFGNITVKGVHGDILDNSIKLNIPIKYKGFNFMMTSEGKLEVKDKDIVYIPSYFKVGKVNLPKAFVLEKLQKHLVKGTAIKDNNIIINKNILPLEIKSIEIKNKEVYIDLEKASGSLEKKIISLYKNIKDSLGVKVTGDSSNTSSNNSNTSLNSSSSDNSNNKLSSESSNGSGNSSSSENSSKDKSTNSESSSKREQALSRINSGLSAAMSSVSTGSQRAVIGQMQSVVNTMAGNPSYNPYSASGSIKASYKGLSAKEKTELKSAVFSNVDGDSVNIILSMLGM